MGAALREEANFGDGALIGERPGGGAAMVHGVAVPESEGRTGDDWLERPMKRFSIITVVLNNADGLRLTAESLGRQDRELYEWLVIDGGSTDGTLEVARSFADRLDRLVSEPDRGLYDAMNKGLRLATGEYVLFLNSRDTLTPNALRDVETALTRVSAADAYTFIIGAAVQLFPNGMSRTRHPISFDSLWHRIPSSHQATFIRRTEHLQVPHDLSYPVSSDYYTIANIYLNKKHPVLYLDVTISETPFGAGSFTARNFGQMLKDHRRVQKEVLKVGAVPRALSLARKVGILGATRLLSAFPKAS